MDFNRRQFLQLGSISLLAPQLTYAKDYEELYYGNLAICQGATDETTTQISILHERAINYDFLASSTKDIFRPNRIKSFTFENDKWVVTQLYFKDLNPDSQYELFCLANGVTIDHRLFRTRNLNRPQGRIAVASCMQDILHHSGVWNALWDAQPEYIFFVGDAVYCDFDGRSMRPANPERLWSRHVDTRNRIQGYRRKELIPILAMWDDHDYGSNNSDRNYRHKVAAKRTFDAFFPQEPALCPALGGGPGMAKHFKAYGQNFFFLDGRSYRSPSRRDEEGLFGAEQSKWLYDGLSNVNTPAWIISGSQFFGKYRGKDSFETVFHDQFREFTDQIKNTRVPVGFMSGDIHHSEVMKIEREFFGFDGIEITSSSMHSFTFPGHHLRHRNPRRQAATSAHNFILVNTAAGSEDVRITMESQKSGRRTNFKTSFHLKASS